MDSFWLEPNGPIQTKLQIAGHSAFESVLFSHSVLIIGVTFILTDLIMYICVYDTEEKWDRFSDGKTYELV